MQAPGRVSDGFEHAFHLVLATFVDDQLDPRGPQATHARRRGRAVLELDASGQAAERGLARPPLHLGDVDLVYLVTWMREPVRERAVVRKQKRTRRIGVEAADRDDARLPADQVDDGRPAVGVARRRHHAGRLVQQDVGELLGSDPLAVHLDHVATTDVRVQLARSAVHAHAPGLDQLVGGAARGDSGSRQIRVQPHAVIIRGMPHYISLMRWTTQGVAGLPGWRERVEEGERIIEEAGGKLTGVYVTLGRYDVVEIFEAPDDEKAVEILLKLQRYGAEHTETLRAFTREQAEEIIRKL